MHKLLDRRTTRTWTQLTHAHNRYVRSRTTHERDQVSGRVCDGFIPNTTPRASSHSPPHLPSVRAAAAGRQIGERHRRHTPSIPCFPGAW
jgi:hypothetical protein